MEENKFTIGNYSFDTFHEYRDGQEDVRKIELIKSELDIHSPEVAVRLYNMIRSGEIAFKTAIGEDFFVHVSDIVADKSIDMIQDKMATEEVEHRFRFQKLAARVLIGLAACVFVYVAYVEIRDYVNTNRLNKLQEQARQEAAIVAASTEGLTIDPSDESTQDISATASAQEEPEPEPDYFADMPQVWIDRNTLKPLPEYEQRYAENEEFAGWIEIPDATKDSPDVYYPVMQTIDNDYYLTHNYFKSYDVNGSIFVDYRCDIVNEPLNTIVYGHNMKSGKMFGTLKNYLEEDYYNTHRTINFNTVYEHRTYEIIAVCLSKVAFQDEEEFRYYNFISANNENDFEAFKQNVTNLAVYGSGLSMEKEDKLLTLSTCNSYTDDGRLFIVARRVN